MWVITRYGARFEMGTIQVTPGEPGHLIVHFPYSTERVAVIRAMPGRRWHPEEKYWTVPHTPETLERRMRFLHPTGSVLACTGLRSYQCAGPCQVPRDPRYNGHYPLSLPLQVTIHCP